MMLRIGIALRIRGLLLAERAHLLRACPSRLGVGVRDVLRRPSSVEVPIRIGRFLDPRKKTLLIDVGANNGEWASRFVQLFPNTDLELWEPNLHVAEAAKTRFATFPSVRVIEAAASNFKGAASFTIPASAAMGSLHVYGEVVARTPAHGEVTTHDVPVCQIDSVLRNVADHQVVLKLDVQGHEPEALEGAEQTLRSVDVAVVETTLVPVYAGRGPTFAHVVRLMEAAGLHACMFPSAGVIAGSHPCEQDILFVRSGLLGRLLE